MTEEALLQGCIKNNASAQKELYDKYSHKMFAVCYRYGHNREDAEDMLQEGFIKVFSQIHKFENRGGIGRMDQADHDTYLYQYSEKE